MLFIVLFVFISISIYGASFNVEETDENSVSSYVIFATDSVWVFRDSVIHSGNIGVMNKGESFFLDDNIEVVIDRDVYFEDETSILGDTLAMRRGASAFNVYHNSILNSGEIRGEEGTVLDVPLSVILPEFPDPKPGSEDIRVYSGDSLVLDPGSYGNVTVSAYGTLIMTGGTYHLNDLKLGHHEAKLLCQGPTEIIINGRMFSIRNTYIGPEKEEDPNMSAKDIHIYVNGLDGNEGFFRNLPKAVQIGRYSEIHANIYAPNGALWIRGDSIAEGAFIGKDVVIGYNVELFWDAARPFDVLYTFADEGLEAAIREALGKSEGDIFQSDLEAITYLDASERNIQDLHGIEGCINLVPYKPQPAQPYKQPDQRYWSPRRACQPQHAGSFEQPDLGHQPPSGTHKPQLSQPEQQLH
jgi:hypothetical protein